MQKIDETVVDACAREICKAGGVDPDDDWSEPKPDRPNPPFEPAWMSFRAEARACLQMIFTRLSIQVGPLPDKCWGDGGGYGYEHPELVEWAERAASALGVIKEKPTECDHLPPP